MIRRGGRLGQSTAGAVETTPASPDGSSPETCQKLKPFVLEGFGGGPLTLPLRRLNIGGLTLFTIPVLSEYPEKNHVVGDLPDTASKIGE